MASGHASRINRPNTWLLRPDVRRGESPCQRGAVHTWHYPEIRCDAMTSAVIGGRANARSVLPDRQPLTQQTLAILVNLPCP
jgi:hypothetical protein